MMHPYGRRPTPRTVPYDTALALQDRAEAALEEVSRLRASNAQLRETLGATEQALLRTEGALDAQAPVVDDGLDKAVLSLKADLANVRRHQHVQVEQARSEGQQGMVLALVDTFDDLTRAMDVADAAVRTGLVAVRGRVEARLGSAGVKRVGESGEAFDPVRHEATGLGAGPEGVVVGVLQSGVLDATGHLVRPAKVVVGQG